jgi:hypothetical protein
MENPDNKQTTTGEAVGKLDQKGLLRDEKGRLVKGTAPLNPAGQRPGVRHQATILREGFMEAFQKIGGVDELVRWIKAKPANQRDFYKMAIACLPKELDIHSEQKELKLIVIRAEGHEDDQATITISRDKPDEVEVDAPIKHLTDESEKESEL